MDEIYSKCWLFFRRLDQWGHRIYYFNKTTFLFIYLYAPHKPLQLPQEYYDKYKDKEIIKSILEIWVFYVHWKWRKRIKEDARKVYGMVYYIDII